MWVIIYFSPIFCSKFRFRFWFHVLSNKYNFGILLLYNYINLRSSIIFCFFFWRYIYFFRYFLIMLNIYNCLWAFCKELFDTFIILLAILLTIKSPAASAIFLVALFEVVLSASVAWSSSFCLYLLYRFFTYILFIFKQKTKIHKQRLKWIARE